MPAHTATADQDSADKQARAARARRRCDLIMKGGITSGVAYPAAVAQLSEDYDFVSVGGASAGAIAAAVTAAAQYARDEGGFRELDTVRRELQTPNLLPRLFRATKETRPLLDLLLAAQAAQAQPSPGLRTSAFLRGVVGRVLGRLALPLAVWTSLGFAALALLLGHAGAAWPRLTWPAYTMLALLLVAVAAVALVGLVVGRLWRAVSAYLPSSNYGMCLGVSEEASRAGRERHPALTEWLHEKIQQVAGRPGGAPLTFADLAGRGTRLLLITTDLTWTRPVRLPCPEPQYYFSVDELHSLFPPDVVRHMVGARAPERLSTPDGERELYPLPAEDLPVLVAVRMSLSFPVLLSAVPLWAKDDADGQTRRHWFSDGGIGSNFPIHFFDAWVPTRPTFGLDLVQLNRARSSKDPCDYVKVYLDKAPAPTTVPIRSLLGFLRQILSTMQDWHDTLQSELAGFHDRIAHIELSAEEGGLNIAMPKQVITFIDEKGACAGRKLSGFDWEHHQRERYEIFMGMLQDGLSPHPVRDGPPRATVRSAWDAGLADRVQGYAQAPPAGDAKPAAWYRAAHAATAKLLDDADRWLAPLDRADAQARPEDGDPEQLSFRPGQPLTPPACMRVTPEV